MRDLNYLWVFVGFAVVVDIAFLALGRRPKGVKGDRSQQLAIPFDGAAGLERTQAAGSK
jgi:hypothetical protein